MDIISEDIVFEVTHSMLQFSKTISSVMHCYRSAIHFLHKCYQFANTPV